MSCVQVTLCVPEFVRNFFFPTLTDTGDSEISLAHFLKDSLQETLFNGCHYSNGCILAMKYFCCQLNFPRRFVHLI